MNEPSIADLKGRIEQREEEQDRLREDVSRAQMDEWEGRLDDVVLQLHLGTMELRERLDPLVETAQGELLELSDLFYVGGNESVCGYRENQIRASRRIWAMVSCTYGVQLRLPKYTGSGGPTPRVSSKKESPATPNFFLTTAEESARTNRKKS